MILGSNAIDRLAWFCLRTKGRRELTAAVGLRERVGIEVYAPRIRVRRPSRAGGAVATLAEALFPGYIFARFHYAAQSRHVLSCRGVTGIVAIGTEPTPVADDMIAYFQTNVTTAASDTPILNEGDWVRIVGGCFRAAEGRVLHFDPATDRVRLLLVLLGREIQVSVPARQVLARNSSPLRDYPAGVLRDGDAPPASAA